MPITGTRVWYLVGFIIALAAEQDFLIQFFILSVSVPPQSEPYVLIVTINRLFLIRGPILYYHVPGTMVYNSETCTSGEKHDDGSIDHC